MQEIWKDIKGYEGKYQVSNLGRVKSLSNNYIKKPRINKGYYRVSLSYHSKKKYMLVHRLVAETFISNPYNYNQVNHINENKLDNRVTNLEFCNAQYNINYGNRNKKTSVSLTNNIKRSKTVYQYTYDGKLVNTFPSSREVARALGYKQSNISACCTGKMKRCYGYLWSYSFR